MKHLYKLFALLSFAFALSACINSGSGTMTVFNPDVSAGIQLGYQRGSAQDVTTAEAGGATDDGDLWMDTQGGGEVAASATTKVGNGDDALSADLDTDAVEEEDEVKE